MFSTHNWKYLWWRCRCHDVYSGWRDLGLPFQLLVMIYTQQFPVKIVTEDWIERHFIALFGQSPWKFDPNCNKVVSWQRQPWRRGTGRAESVLPPPPHVRILHPRSVLGPSDHLRLHPEREQGGLGNIPARRGSQMAPEGAFWNMYNLNHLEIQLIKWDILKNGK